MLETPLTLVFFDIVQRRREIAFDFLDVRETLTFEMPFQPKKEEVTGR